MVQQTTTTPYALAGAEHLTIGGRDSSGTTFGNFFNGSIYDVCIYNTALSEAQVNDLVVLTTPPVTAPVFSAPPTLSGDKLVLTWANGTLLQSTNAAGPYTATGATSPYTNDISTAPQMYFRLRIP